MSRGVWDALRLLRRDNTIVIKPANKGSMVVVVDREQYIRQAMRQLQDSDFYRPLEQSIYLESVGIIEKELALLQRHGGI